MSNNITKFLELASPDENGISREVFVDEFVGEYADLCFGNGGSWCRSDGSLGKKYIIEKTYDTTKGKKIKSIKLTGLNDNGYSNRIDSSIVKALKDKTCVFSGCSCQIEIDHKNGRKNEDRVMTGENQTIDDFQPVHRSINLIKRGICNKCKETGIRFDARLLGYPLAVVYGEFAYTEDVGCRGCYYFDPIAFNNAVTKL